MGRVELSLGAALAGNAEPGAVLSPGPCAQGGSSGDPAPLQGQLGVHWELSQQFLPMGISLHKDLVLTQPHFLCPALLLLSPAASAEPLTFPPFRAAVSANQIFYNQLNQKQTGDEESRKWQLCVGMWEVQILPKLMEVSKF